MPVTLSWHDIALRLALTFVTAAVIGWDRGEHGRAAGLRTTLLLSVAACVAMLQANALMYSVGKTPDSFVVLDLMRLPLGILSGVGFIGAGAILRCDNLVIGVTTAATMWFVTVLGLYRPRTVGPGAGGLRTGAAGAVGYETDRRFIFAAASSEPDADDGRGGVQRKRVAVHVGGGRAENQFLVGYLFKFTASPRGKV